MYGILKDEPKFKVGDRVHCNGDFSFDPSIGTIVSRDKRKDLFGVKVDGQPDDEWSYFQHELHLIGAQPAPKYKVGQRVRFTSEVSPDWWFKAGQTGTIDGLADSRSAYKYEVLVDGEVGTGLVNDEHIQAAFLPGDRVRVNEHSGYFAIGDEGEVERQDDNAVYVKHGAYQRLGLPIESEKLVLIAAQSASNDNQVVTPKFKAGDLVTTSGVPDAGVGQIIERVEDGRWRVNFKDTWYRVCCEPEERLTLATRVATDTSGYVTGVSIAQPQPCIVARVVDGVPRPSNVPYVHDSVQSATTEAERLATNNPGKEFAVYQRVTARVAEVSYSMREVA